MEKLDLQNKLDVEKWLQSETKQRDLCGEYDYCAYCTNNKDYPCATAYLLMKKVEEEKSSQPTNTQVVMAEEDIQEEREVSTKKSRRKRLTFAEKLEKVSEKVRFAYDSVCDEIMSYDNVAEKVIQTGHNFRIKRKLVAKITILGKENMRLNLALDPDKEEYNTGKFPHIDNRPKKTYEGIAMSIKIGSPLSIKRATKLIADVMADNSAD